MGDVVGRLFREFAVTLAVAILISAFVSLTLVPMLCAKLFRHELETERTPPAGRTRQWFDAVVAVYGRALDTVLEHERLTLALAALTLLLTVYLYVVIPKGFFPTQDTGVLQGISVAPQSISFAAMAARQQALADVILEDPDVESLSSFIGIDGVNMTMNSGRFLINLKPHDKRRARDHRYRTPPHQGHRNRHRHRALPSAGAGSGDRNEHQPHPISVRPRRTPISRVRCLRPEAGRAPPASAARSRTSPALSKPRDSPPSSLSIVRPPRGSALRWPRSTTRSTMLSGNGSSRPSSPNRTQRRVILETNPAFTPSAEALMRLYLPSSTSSGGEVPLVGDRGGRG